MQALHHPELSALLAQEGLPPLVGVTELSSSGARLIARLDFAEEQQPLRLVRLRWNPGYDPFQNALAASHVLVGETLPTPAALRVFPEGALSLPAALLPPPAGQSARTATPQTLFRGLATVLRELQEFYQVQSTSSPCPGRLSPGRVQ